MSGNPLTKASPRGHNGYELLSAMQKFIRRSMEEEALYCFYELEATGCYLIAKNRLLVTVYEDVGLANQELVNSINLHTHRMDEFYKSNNGAWRLVLGYIILSACRGQKTRVTDQFVCTVAAKMIDGFYVDFNEHDFVYDMHTLKGKQLKRGAQHFYDEGSKIIESKITTDYWQEEQDYSNIVEAQGFNVLEDYKKTKEQIDFQKNSLDNQLR